jgi:hypothetical protein
MIPMISEKAQIKPDKLTNKGLPSQIPLKKILLLLIKKESR